MKGFMRELAASDQTAHLERWIDQRTGSRVHCLRVETTGGRVVVYGHAGSYHVRQLVLAAVLEALEADPPTEVNLAIEVDVV